MDIYRKVSIAPMLDRTDKHFRYFLRLISGYPVLYTEMIPEASIYHNRNHPDRLKKILDFHKNEKPLIIQIAGNTLQYIPYIAEEILKRGYDGFNLNAGCPSDSAVKGNFGVILMNDPASTGKYIKEIKKYLPLPVSIKHRLGFLSEEIQKTRFEDLKEFIKICYDQGCHHFIIHARFAYLGSMSPRKNSTIPPLMYEWVYRIKEEFPYIRIELNGGIKTTEEILYHLQFVDGVMIGRAAYENPYFLHGVDSLFGMEAKKKSREEIFREYYRYILEEMENGVYPHSIVKHTFGLFAGMKNQKKWKTLLWENLLKLKRKPLQAISGNEVLSILEDSLQLLDFTGESQNTPDIASTVP